MESAFGAHAAGIWVPTPIPFEAQWTCSIPRLESALRHLSEHSPTGAAIVEDIPDIPLDALWDVYRDLGQAAQRASLPLAVGLCGRDGFPLEELTRHLAGAGVPCIWALAEPQEVLGQGLLGPQLGAVCDAAEEADVILSLEALEFLPSEEELRQLLEWAPGLLGVEVRGAHEGWLEEVEPLNEELLLVVTENEFASGFRRGVRAARTLFGALSPQAAVAWCETMEQDIQDALQTELRVQRFFETQVSSLVRRTGLGVEQLQRVCASAGGWFPLSDPPTYGEDLSLQEYAESLATAAASQLVIQLD